MTAAVVGAGDGLALTLPELLAARAATRGQHRLLICDDEVLTYGEAERRSATLAAGLRAAGAGPGTHVGLFYPNSAAFVVAAFAVARIGAITLPLSTMSSAPELRTLLGSADIELLLASPSYRQRDHIALVAEATAGGAASLPALRRVVFGLDELMGEAAASAPDASVPGAAVRPEDRLVIVHTSGSTSRPKGVIHRHGPLIRHLDNLNAIRRYASHEILFSNSPFFWIGGYAYSLLGTLLAGATLVCSNATDPADTLDLLEKVRPTMVNGFAQTVAPLAAHRSFAGRDLSSIRRGNLWPIMPPDVRPADPELRHNMLGMTETGSVCLQSDDESDQPEHRRGSFGKPVPGYEARIVDPDTGADCAVGAVGELWLRSPFLMEGYYGRERADTFEPDGWYRTGDLFRVDSEGWYYFIGRRGDMIKTKGANVSPREVEAAIADLTGFASHVVGLDDGAHSQSVAAAIRVSEGDRPPDLAELRVALRSRLSPYKVPQTMLVLRDDEVPMLSSGKLDAQALKERLIRGADDAPCPSLAPLYRDDPRLAPLIGPGGRFEVEEVVIDGIRLRSFVRAPRSILECFAMGRAHPSLVNVVFENERWTFGEVRERALRVAHELRSSFGVARGDRVAIAMRNLPELIVSFWAAVAAGAIVVPLNSWWTGAELRYALDHCGARVVFADDERVARLLEAGAPSALQLVAVRATAVGHRAVAFDELAHAPPLGDDEIAVLEPDDPVTILYTSGTTWRPKGALGTSRGHIANLWNMAFVNAREALIAERAVDPPRQSASIVAAPLFHIGGVAGIIGGPMGGSKMVLMRKWDVDEALRLAEQEAVTSLGGVPAMARQLFEHPRIAEADLDIRAVPLGGSAVAPDLPLKALALFGSTQVFNGYGLTETTSAVVTNVGVEFAARPGSVGRANLTADVKVVDPDDGRDLGAGEVGELCMRSPQVVKGYWNDEAATSASFVDGWFHSGDVGYIDDEGWIYVVDRLKDVVIRGGENVYSAEVEAVLHEHPAIAEVAIVGIDDVVLGERVCAVVVARPGATIDLAALRSFAGERLARFKCPEALMVVTELPKTATEKIAKRELRALVGAPGAPIERMAP